MERKMKNHTKIFYKAFNYPLHPDTFVESEISKERAVDIHHIVNRENRIENLMAVTRTEHNIFGEKKNKMTFLLKLHRFYLIDKGVDFDNDWFEFWIKKYEIYED